MASNVPTSAPAATSGHKASSRGHGAAGVPPAAADSTQSSTASALIDSINASARLHQPPRGIGKHSHPGSGPSSGLTIGNIMDDSGLAPGKGPSHTSVAGAGVPPAATNPADTSTSASLTESRVASSKINQYPRGVHEPVLGNVADEGQVRRE